MIDPGDATHLWVGDPQPGEMANPAHVPVIGYDEDGWPVVEHP
jgi:hypothetical protein